MLYREFGKTREKVSILGFGCMRFPVDSEGVVDESKAIEMIRYGIDNGVNYVDTAYPYHKGQSEIIVGKALQDGYRDKVLLATKCPSWLINTREDMDKYLDEQLTKLQTDHIDFYLLHALNRSRWENYMSLDVIDFLEKAKASGKVHHVGFSFHDGADVFKNIIDSYDGWEFCQIQYNYLDEYTQAGIAGLRYANQKGLGVVIMEPLRGGNLCTNLPEDIAKMWDNAEIKRTPAEWGLKFLWNQPEVSVVLSGMGAMEQVKSNIISASDSNVGCLNVNEVKLVNAVANQYKARLFNDCTGCSYCMPCPSGVDIPEIFHFANLASMFGDPSHVFEAYKKKITDDKKPTLCVRCGKCEKVCPQHMNIREYLVKANEFFNK